VAEGSALEKRYPVNRGIVGSNPTLSATIGGLILVVLSRADLPRFILLPPNNGLAGYKRPEHHPCRVYCGEMTELAEGARLEIVCAVKGTEGSNPSLSATTHHHPPAFAFCYLELNQG
jgi:hypothetical protein